LHYRNFILHRRQENIYTKHRYLYFEHTDQQAKALEAQRQLMLVKDSLSISKDQQAYKKILLRMETEKHLTDIDKLEADHVLLHYNAIQ
jgi:predicted nuclease of restriction endonuclease-like RecB superfamily